jgi:hypothetical protein
VELVLRKASEEERAAAAGAEVVGVLRGDGVGLFVVGLGVVVEQDGVEGGAVADGGGAEERGGGARELAGGPGPVGVHSPPPGAAVPLVDFRQIFFFVFFPPPGRERRSGRGWSREKGRGAEGVGGEERREEGRRAEGCLITTAGR